MIGRMRPFYQAHWDISKDIKHVWLLICTYYIAWIFQWILSGEGRGKWWDRQYRVWIPQCAAPLDVTVTYARDSFVDSPSVLRPGCCCYMQEIAPVDYWHQAHISSLGGPRHFGTGPGLTVQYRTVRLGRYTLIQVAFPPSTVSLIDRCDVCRKVAIDFILLRRSAALSLCICEMQNLKNALFYFL